MTTRLLYVTTQIWDQVSVRILHKLSIPCLDSNWHTNHIWLLKIQEIPETELATQSSSNRFEGPSGVGIKFPYTSCTYCSAYACKAIGTWTVTSSFLKHKKSLKPLGNWFSVPESKEHLFWKKRMSSRIENIWNFCCENINHLSRLHAHAHGEQIVHLMIWKQLTHGRHLMILETQVSAETSSIAALWKEIEWHRLSE
jgi:hypothetical protein